MDEMTKILIILGVLLLVTLFERGGAYVARRSRWGGTGGVGSGWEPSGLAVRPKPRWW